MRDTFRRTPPTVPEPSRSTCACVVFSCTCRCYDPVEVRLQVCSCLVLLPSSLLILVPASHCKASLVTWTPASTSDSCKLRMYGDHVMLVTSYCISAPNRVWCRCVRVFCRLTLVRARSPTPSARCDISCCTTTMASSSHTRYWVQPTPPFLCRPQQTIAIMSFLFDFIIWSSGFVQRERFSGCVSITTPSTR